MKKIIYIDITESEFKNLLNNVESNINIRNISNNVLADKVKLLKTYNGEEILSFLDALKDGKYTNPSGWFLALNHMDKYAYFSYKEKTLLDIKETDFTELLNSYTISDYTVSDELISEKINSLRQYSDEEFRLLVNSLQRNQFASPITWCIALEYLYNNGDFQFNEYQITEPLVPMNKIEKEFSDSSIGIILVVLITTFLYLIPPIFFEYFLSFFFSNTLSYILITTIILYTLILVAGVLNFYFKRGKDKTRDLYLPFIPIFLSVLILSYNLF